MSDPLDLPIRPRRLRHPLLRPLLQRVALRRRDVIVPVFVREGTGIRQEVTSMPGVFQMTVDVAVPWLAARAEEGFGAYLVFGAIDRPKKAAVGAGALARENVACGVLRERTRQGVAMASVTDLCSCKRTSDGHCGPLT